MSYEEAVIQRGKEFLSPPALPDLPVFKQDRAYAGIASIPRRQENLELTISTVYQQFDHIFVYLNEYENVPSWLIDDKIIVFRSQDYMDLNATGKVFFASSVDKGYYFTLDDDFFYPSNYVSHMIGTIKKYNDRVATCVHGSIFPSTPEYYYLRTNIYQYQRALISDRFVCLPGTGSFAVKAGLLPLSLNNFLPEVMVDLACAILCKEHKVPLVSVRRPNFWLQNTDRDGLYQAFSAARTHHSTYATQYGPWGFSQYREAVRDIGSSLDLGKNIDKMRKLNVDVDAFFSAADNEMVPAPWSETSEYYNRLIEHIQMRGEGNT